jgi:hypothetical protein
VLSESLPQLLANNDNIRDLHNAMQSSDSEAAKRANFQRLFEAVIFLWVSGEINPPNVETWQEFCARVNRGLSEFLTKSRKGESSPSSPREARLAWPCSAPCIFRRQTRYK